MKFYKFPFLLLFIFYSMSVFAEKSYFKNISHLLPDQSPRLSYGVAVTDFDNDGNDEFIVTGFRFSNLALGFNGERFENIYGAAGHPKCIFKIDFENLIKITHGISEDIIE